MRFSDLMGGVDWPYSIRDADFWTVCSGCGFRQWLTQMNREDTDETHAIYRCGNYSEVVFDIRPSDEAPEGLGIPIEGRAVVGDGQILSQHPTTGVTVAISLRQEQPPERPRR